MLSHGKWVDSSHIVVDVDHLRVLDPVHFHVKIHSACLDEKNELIGQAIPTWYVFVS